MSRQLVASTFRVEETSTFVGNVLANGTGTNEVVTLTITGTPTGGSVVLFIAGVPVTLTWNSTTAATTTAMNAALGAGSVSVTGGTFPGAAQVMTFSANYAGADIPLPVLAVNGLTGGTAPTMTITGTTPGGGSISATSIATGIVSAGRAYLGGAQVQGNVTIAAAAPGNVPLTLRVADSTSAINIVASSAAVSERAGITLGTWIMGQDLAGNGGLDFFIWNGANRIGITAAGVIKVGNSSETMRFVGDNSYLSFFEGTEVTRRGYVQGISSGMNVVADGANLDMYANSQLLRLNSGCLILNGQIRMGTWPANGSYTGLLDRASGAANNYLIMADTADTLISTPGSTGVVRIRPRNNGTAGEATFTNTTASFQGSVVAYRNGGTSGSGATDGWYYNASFYAGAADIWGGGVTASLAFHPGTYAPQFRCGSGYGGINVRDSTGNNDAPMTGSAFTATSTRRIKKDIHGWPGKSLSSAVPSALSVIERLRPVSYSSINDSIAGVPSTERRRQAMIRLHEYQRARGLPLYVDWHDCSKHDCKGSAEQPCAEMVNHTTPNIGFIAEEVFPVLPEAVTLDEDYQPRALNYGTFSVVAIAALQELVTTTNGLVSRVAELEAKLAAA